MAELAKIQPVNIEDELRKSYLDYAMSVIVGRALPDVRDGLKPVHRRVLFAMHELGNDWNKAHKKSARIVGDVLAKYHPHGDTAVYDTIVRMAQPFSMRYMLVDGQGNFGSVDGDAAAAMRYTEIRMTKLAHSLLADLDKDTVDFVPNYDETEFAPTVLPNRVPNLLINGSSGIAVGMATNIPPHNITEVLNGCLALMDNPAIGIEGLMEHIKGPDFPTQGIINGKSGIIDAYNTGRGKIYVRAKYHVEEGKADKKSIIVTELPYQVNKARLIEKIAELVKDKKIDGITGLRDESDKDGMRVVIELRRGEIAEVVVNNLYTQTQLQSVFGINMVALVDGQPRTLTLKQTLEYFILHRREVVTRRVSYELAKAKGRAHVLEGLSIALANIDEIIRVIKAAPTPMEAKEALLKGVWQPGQIEGMLGEDAAHLSKPDDLESAYGLHNGSYRLSVAQAQAILDLRLHRLTGLEQDKISTEYKEILLKIKEYIDILRNEGRLLQVIRTELEEVKEQFGDARRTEIVAAQQDLTREDLITAEDMVVTVSSQGYVKAQSLEHYKAQRRGGRGKAAATVKDEDFIDKLVIANTHDTILCFSNRGKVYWLKVYQLPVGSRTSKGRPIVNLLPLEKEEVISAILPLQEYSEDKYVFMATAYGVVKKVALQDFSRPRSSGIIAVDLDEGDKLVGVDITDGSKDIILFSDAGKAMRFAESEVRTVGRTARGVRGIKLFEQQQVISLIVLDQNKAILTASEKGFGKRTDSSEFAKKGRGGQGVISMQTNERNGKVVGAVQVTDTDDVMLITDAGTLVRTRVSEISLVGRNTQGVRLINLISGEALVGLQRIAEIDGCEEEDSSAEPSNIESELDTHEE